MMPMLLAMLVAHAMCKTVPLAEPPEAKPHPAEAQVAADREAIAAAAIEEGIAPFVAPGAPSQGPQLPCVSQVPADTEMQTQVEDSAPAGSAGQGSSSTAYATSTQQHTSPGAAAPAALLPYQQLQSPAQSL